MDSPYLYEFVNDDFMLLIVIEIGTLDILRRPVKGCQPALLIGLAGA
jgi:hypothetical protein